MSHGKTPVSGKLSDLGPPGVQRVAAPIRQQTLEIVRDAILDFRLQPGQRLIERELQEWLGVSRTTVREVLRHLTSEGLVSANPNQGVTVVLISPSEAADLYEVRDALEGLIVKRFTREAPDEQVATLRAAFDEYESVMADTSATTQDRLRRKDRFYNELLAGSGNREAEAVLKGLHARIQLLKASSLSEPGRVAESVQELRSVVEAIERRDAESAVQACTVHIARAATVATEVLAKLGGDGTPVNADRFTEASRSPRIDTVGTREVSDNSE